MGIDEEMAAIRADRERQRKDQESAASARGAELQRLKAALQKEISAVLPRIMAETKPYVSLGEYKMIPDSINEVLRLPYRAKDKAWLVAGSLGTRGDGSIACFESSERLELWEDRRRSSEPWTKLHAKRTIKSIRRADAEGTATFRDDWWQPEDGRDLSLVYPGEYNRNRYWGWVDNELAFGNRAEHKTFARMVAERLAI